MKIIISLVFLLNVIFASDTCENKFFTFNTSSYKDSVVTILDLIQNLANECKISILIEDNITQGILTQKLSYINIQDYSLNDLFGLLLSDHNLFYEYDSRKSMLKISFLETKSFYIDYINFTNRKSEIKKSINTGSGSSTSSTDGDPENSKPSSGNEDSISSVSEFKFWERIENDINELLQRDGDSYKIQSNVFINPEAGLVTITGTKKQLDRVVAYIDTIHDRLHKQIMIEAKILEVTYTDASSTGIDWSKFDLSLFGHADEGYSAKGASVIANNLNVPINTFAYNFDMNGFIQFLKQNGHVTLLSNPKILTLNNQAAIINVGDQINYKYYKYRYRTEDKTYQPVYQPGEISSPTSNTPTPTVDEYAIGSVFVGVTLNIIPEVTKDGFILLTINPIISDFRDLNQVNRTARDMPPDIKIKQLSSIVKVKDRNRVVIGGLITNTIANDGNKVPLLGDAPVIGYAFKRKKIAMVKSELILIITPKIVDGTTNISLDEIETKFNETNRKDVK